MSVPNLSWLFYKDYYAGFRFWKNDDKEGNKGPISSFFKKKNDKIIKSVLPELPVNGNKEINLVTTYPGLIVGTGYTHETKNEGEFKIGFHFDYTYGVPVIPGSSVKGLIRSAFPQFKRNKKKIWERDTEERDTEIKREKARYIGSKLLNWKEEGEALLDKVHELEQHLFEGLNIMESVKEDKAIYYSVYKRDIFYDAFPTAILQGDNKSFLGTDAITPHGDNPLQNPVPLPFVKILPGVMIRFGFNLVAADCHLLTAEKRKELYEKILLEFGAGAKTNVGYGQFETTHQFTSRAVNKGIIRDLPKMPPPRFK